MVIWVKEFFTCNGISTSCNDFVYIHIGLGAASCLPYSQWKVVIQLTCQYFIAGL